MEPHRHRQLIKGIWPDKLMYGSIMLFVTGLVGTLYSLAALTLGVGFSRKIPLFLRIVPPWLSLILVGAALVLAYLAMRRQRVDLAFAAAALGVASLALVGIVSLLSLIALGFVIAAVAEGEHKNVETRKLTAAMWPDKSLAASLLLFMTGIMTLAWGLAVLTDQVAFGGATRALIGTGQVLAAMLLLYAASHVYHQRALALAFIAGIVGIIAFAGWVIGPILSLAALILLYKASAEGEFDAGPAAA